MPVCKLEEDAKYLRYVSSLVVLCSKVKVFSKVSGRPWIVVKIVNGVPE